MFRTLFLSFILGIVLNSDLRACSPYAALTVNSSQIVGNTLQINITSNTAWACCYTTRLELVCASQNFTNNFQYNTNQICKPNTGPMAYNQLNIDISQYCPGTILKWRAREANGPLTATYTVTVPGNVALAVTPSASPASVCIGECTDLSAVTTGSCGNNLTYSWSNGAGNGQTVNVCPIENTSYTVTVTDPRDICGALTATNTVTVNLEPPLSVGIASIQPAVVCVGDDASLTIPGAVGDIQWQTSSSGAPPWTDIPGATTTTYTYAGAIVNAFFRAEVSNACQTDYSNVVDLTVLELPSSNFSFTTVCEGNSTSFEHLLQPDVISWQWEFGDNNGISALPDPGYTYTQFGFYDVTLIVTGSNGCVATLTETIEVYPNPIADFLFDSVCFPLPIQFTDQSLDNGAYSITQWSWDFTDNQTTIQQSPLMTFPVFGAYGATLTVTNSVGCKSEVTLGDALVHPLPVADFDANLEHCYLDVLEVTDMSTVYLLSNDVITTWSYTLGDGASINTPDGQHNYPSAGFYNLQLLTTTNNSCLDSITKTVEVYPLPSVGFSASLEEGCDPLAVRFLDVSSIAPPYALVDWEWNLGVDGQTPGVQNPSFVYNPDSLGALDAATYDVALIVTSGNGCVDSLLVEDYITVHPLPDALFSTDPERVTNIIDPVFNLTDLSTANVVVWNWDFGNGQQSWEQNPISTYSDTGSYVIELMVETPYGCFDTVSYTVQVEPNFTFYVPNSFTPNGDGVNDYFFGIGEYIKNYRMEIYDRWGELIFLSSNMEYSWDGRYKGKDVQQGQYVSKFYVTGWANQGHEYIGSVRLHR